MNLGIMELTAIERDTRKTALRVAALDKPNDVPPGYTAVYLREQFFHVMPDELMPAVKGIFFNGFEWDKEKQWIKGNHDFSNSLAVAEEIIIMRLQWVDKLIKQDG